MGARRPVIGVMGAGEGATAEACKLAEALGESVARRGWVLLTGGRDVGVMDAAARGAKRVEHGLAVGILPGAAGGASSHLDIAIFTGMGHARDAINVLSSDVVVACGAGGAGTAAEVALAIKSGKPLVLLAPDAAAEQFFRSFAAALHVAATVEEAMETVAALLARAPATR